jgi:hypothetical protein
MKEELLKAKVVRPCDGCTSCCYLLPVEELNKPLRQMCKYANKGCTIWAPKELESEYPDECRKYRCAWILGLGEEEDRPDLSGVLVDIRKGPCGLGLYAIEVVPGTPEKRESIKLALERIGKDAGLPVHLVDQDMKRVDI